MKLFQSVSNFPKAFKRLKLCHSFRMLTSGGSNFYILDVTACWVRVTIVMRTQWKLSHCSETAKQARVKPKVSLLTTNPASWDITQKQRWQKLREQQQLKDWQRWPREGTEGFKPYQWQEVEIILKQAQRATKAGNVSSYHKIDQSKV